MNLSFIVALRDSCQDIVNACNAEIELSNPENKYDAEKILWIRATSDNGVYERYPAYKQKPTLTPDYNNLVQDLKEHDRYFEKNGIKYWLFDDLETIGRKPV